MKRRLCQALAALTALAMLLLSFPAAVFAAEGGEALLIEGVPEDGAYGVIVSCGAGYSHAMGYDIVVGSAPAKAVSLTADGTGIESLPEGTAVVKFVRVGSDYYFCLGNSYLVLKDTPEGDCRLVLSDTAENGARWTIRADPAQPEDGFVIVNAEYGRNGAGEACLKQRGTRLFCEPCEAEAPQGCQFRFFRTEKNDTGRVGAADPMRTPPADGSTVVIYNAFSGSVFGPPADEAAPKPGLTAVAAAPKDGRLSDQDVGDGGLIFTVSASESGYTFRTGDKYLGMSPNYVDADTGEPCNDENLLLVDEVSDYTQWTLRELDGGWLITNKSAAWRGNPVCLEYFDGLFCGYSFDASRVPRYAMGFFEVEDRYGMGRVVNPAVVLGEDLEAEAGRDCVVRFTVNDCNEIRSAVVTYWFDDADGSARTVDTVFSGRTGSVTIPAAELEGSRCLTVEITVLDSMDLTFTVSKTLEIRTEPSIRPTAPSAEIRSDAAVALQGVPETVTAVMSNRGGTEAVILTGCRVTAGEQLLEERTGLSETVVPGGEKRVELTYTPPVTGTVQTCELTAVFTFLSGGREYTLRSTAETVSVPEGAARIGIDRGHGSCRVGDGPGVTAFFRICAEYGVLCEYLEAGELTVEALRQYELVILPAPFSGQSDPPPVWTGDELAALAAYAREGGSIINLCRSDRWDCDETEEGGDAFRYAAASLSDLINEAVGADARFVRGTVVDNVRGSGEDGLICFEGRDLTAGGHPFTRGIWAETIGAFRFCDGTGIILPEGSDAVRLIRPYPSSWIVCSRDGFTGPGNVPDYRNDTVAAAKGSFSLVTYETLSGGGFLLCAGAVFLTDDDLKSDVSASRQYENCALVRNLLRSLTDDGGDPCAAFTDVVRTAWYHGAVDFAVERRLMNGTAETTFEPEGTLTRGMLVTILHRAAGAPEAGMSGAFTDLTEDWYRSAVDWAVEAGVTRGTSATTFEPDSPVTREQLAAFVYRFAGAQGEAADAELEVFPDAGSVDDWAREPLRWAVARGVVNGSDEGGVLRLLPLAPTTRAQVAAVLMRYLRAVESAPVTADRRTLERLLEVAEGLDPELFTEQTVAVLHTAREEARAILARQDAAPAQIDAAARALNEALAGLLTKTADERVKDEFVRTSRLRDGDQVVICHPASRTALSSAVKSNYYLAPVEVSVVDDRIVGPDAAAVWTVSCGDDGVFRFRRGELELAACADGGNVDLSVTGDGCDPCWILEPLGGGFVLRSSSVVNGSAQPVCVEYVQKYAAYAALATEAPAAETCAMQFFVKTDASAQQPPED